MKIAMGDVASVTRYSRRQSDGATGCVCMKDGRRIRVRNVDAFLLAQPKPKPLIDELFDRFEALSERLFG